MVSSSVEHTLPSMQSCNAACRFDNLYSCGVSCKKLSLYLCWYMHFVRGYGCSFSSLLAWMFFFSMSNYRWLDIFTDAGSGFSLPVICWLCSFLKFLWILWLYVFPCILHFFIKCMSLLSLWHLYIICSSFRLLRLFHPFLHLNWH